MMPRRRGRLLASGLAAFALTVTVSGCGAGTTTGDTDRTDAAPSAAAPEPSTAASSTPATPTVTQVPTPTSTSPAPSEKHTSAAPEPAPARGLVAALVTAAELPGLNDQLAWQEASTRSREGRKPFGTCHRFAMTSIGALRVAVRTYAPDQDSPGTTASNLVARFADEKTAKRVYEVLKSWHTQCADQLREKYERTDVGKLRTVPVGQGAVGSWYLLVYGPAGDPDAAYFDAQGLTRVGSTISVLQMRSVGQDYNYPAGKEPMVGAVQAAAARIG